MLLLSLMRIGDPTPEQDAAAHVLAFGLRDLRELRIIMGG